MTTFFFLFLLLNIFSSLVVAAKECHSDVSRLIKATLANGELFSSCMANAGIRLNVHSLLDVLNFSERDFLIFCRSGECIEPVETLVYSIPTDCLIKYHGSARNVSKEVSRLYHRCAEVVGAADKTDEEYLYRYFLD